jgi:4-oxalocrotonate tautomerase
VGALLPLLLRFHLAYDAKLCAAVRRIFVRALLAWHATRAEGASSAQKAELIAAITDALVRILAKDPSTTFFVIDEVALEDWGIGGLPVQEFRRRSRSPTG